MGEGRVGWIKKKKKAERRGLERKGQLVLCASVLPGSALYAN